MTNEKVDVVIVGAGASGSVYASVLAKAGKKVVLLEAGPDYPDPAYLPEEIRFGHTRLAEAQESKHNWALRGTITEEQGEIHVAQGKVIGGGSSICAVSPGFGKARVAEFDFVGKGWQARDLTDDA